MRAKIDQAEMMAYIDGHTTAAAEMQRYEAAHFLIGETVTFKSCLNFGIFGQFFWSRQARIIASDATVRQPTPRVYVVELSPKYWFKSIRVVEYRTVFHPLKKEK